MTNEQGLAPVKSKVKRDQFKIVYGFYTDFPNSYVVIRLFPASGREDIGWYLTQEEAEAFIDGYMTACGE